MSIEVYRSLRERRRAQEERHRERVMRRRGFVGGYFHNLDDAPGNSGASDEAGDKSERKGKGKPGTRRGRRQRPGRSTNN